MRTNPQPNPLKINIFFKETPKSSSDFSNMPGFKRRVSNQESTSSLKMSDKLTKAINSHFTKQKRSLGEERNYLKPWQQDPSKQSKSRAHRVTKRQKDKIERTCDSISQNLSSTLNFKGATPQKILPNDSYNLSRDSDYEFEELGQISVKDPVADFKTEMKTKQ